MTPAGFRPTIGAVNLERLFSIASALAMLGWLCLAAAPFARDRLVVAARLIAALLCGMYVTFLAHSLAAGNTPQGAGFDTLAAVTILLQSPQAILFAWVHFLAFDLWVGSWETLNAPKVGVPHWLLLPCLALTLLAGPAGLLLYLVVRAARTRGRIVP